VVGHQGGFDGFGFTVPTTFFDVTDVGGGGIGDVQGSTTALFAFAFVFFAFAFTFPLKADDLIYVFIVIDCLLLASYISRYKYLDPLFVGETVGVDYFATVSCASTKEEFFLLFGLS